MAAVPVKKTSRISSLSDLSNNSYILNGLSSIIISLCYSLVKSITDYLITPGNI